MVERFLGDKIALHAGDCLTVLPTLAENSIDSCCCDPPYHLTSIVQRFGAEDAVPPKFKTGAYGGGFKEENGGTGAAFARMSRGFMGKVWDGGDVAFRPETWAAVYRVLKPGAHLVAFGGTRTFHRLACAIEDAGFEIRDTVSWLYSQGFPKSHSLNRNPMCECDNGESSSKYDVHVVRQTNLSAPKCNGEEQANVLLSRLPQQNLSEHGTTRAESESSGAEQSSMGGRIVYRTGQGLSDDIETRSPEGESEWLCVGTHSSSGADARPINGIGRGSASHQSRQSGQSPGESTDLFQSSRPLDDRTLRGCGACPRCGKLKKEFEGFGTALKPAMELCVLARKPLTEPTVAANVLRWGTGAINVDGCRVATDDHNLHSWGNGRSDGSCWSPGRTNSASEPEGRKHDLGRWPANVVHDGSDEVVAAFPASNGGAFAQSGEREMRDNPIYGVPNTTRNAPDNYGDSGSAARYFYTAKADAMDRIGSRHPTIKPLDLMQWLVRLVTPKGGMVLDPFAGTGTTGEAAWREGMSAVLIEAEPEYLTDIRRRMALVLAGPDERQRESIKARNLPRDDGPLFGGSIAG